MSCTLDRDKLLQTLKPALISSHQRNLEELVSTCGGLAGLHGRWI